MPKRVRPYAVLLSASKTGKGGFKHKSTLNTASHSDQRLSILNVTCVRKPWFLKAIWARLSRYLPLLAHKPLTFLTFSRIDTGSTYGSRKTWCGTRTSQENYTETSQGYYGARSRVYRVAFEQLSKLVEAITTVTVKCA